MARASAADGCVAVGGGSTVGLGKAVALEHGCPIVAVPTTYAGSEMTPIWGITAERAQAHRPRPAGAAARVVYDPELTLGLPVGVTVTSGLNAVAHAVEALYAPGRHPGDLADRRRGGAGDRRGAAGARRASRRPRRSGGGPVRRLAVRRRAWGRPRCRCTTRSATCSAAPTTCRTPRRTPWCSRTCSRSTPAPLRRRSTRCARYWTAPIPRPARSRWPARLGAPRSLAELGLRRGGHRARRRRRSLADPYANPGPVSFDVVRSLLLAAYHGSPC